MDQKRPNLPRVFITGACGFIGSHLVERFLNEGYEVWGLDNFLTGDRQNLTLLQSHALASKFHFLEKDVSQNFLPELKAQLGAHLFDAVLHFACPASPVDFARLPEEILRVDSIGTFQTLDVVRSMGTPNCRYIIASTSEVYGDPLVHPQREDYWGNVNTIGPRSCYDEVKRFAEAATMAYHRKFDLNTGIVRIFNTYGPRMRLSDGRVVPNFCGQALRDEAITVYGHGDQTRSFCYVTDLVDGIFRMTTKTAFHEPVNLGNPDEYKIRDFAEIVLKHLPTSQSKLSFKELPQDDPKQRKPDITRARELLGWSPKVSLDEGLKQTIDYFRTRLNA